MISMPKWGYGILLLLIAVFSCVRILFGIDMGDESFYVTFADEWLKRGMAHSDNLSISQTAEFVIYPLIKTYAFFVDGTDGIVLFLRYVFLAIWGGAAYVLYRYLRLKLPSYIALGTACIFFVFIPFNCPAPSYNTIAISALILSVTGYYAAIYTQKNAMLLGVGAGCALAVAVTAYPPLVLLSVIWGGIASYDFKKQSYKSSLYFILSHAVAGVVLLAIFSFFLGKTKLLDIAVFMAAVLHADTYLVGKWQKAADYLLLNKDFLTLVGMFFVMGAVVFLKPSRVIIGLMGVFSVPALAYLCIHGQVLYSSNHDMAVFLLAFGLGFACSLLVYCFRNKETNIFKFPLDFLMKPFALFLISGFIFMYFSNNAAINLPVGGLGAAMIVTTLLAALLDGAFRHGKALAVLWMGSVLVLFMIASITIFYGELAPRWTLTGWEKIQDGAYQGLYTNKLQAQFIKQTSAEIAKIDMHKQKTFTMFGRLCGLYLLTPQSPRAVTTWQISQTQGKESYATIISYFEKNVPDTILRYTDPWTDPLQDFQIEYLKNYRMTSQVDVDNRHLEIWERKAAP